MPRTVNASTSGNALPDVNQLDVNQLDGSDVSAADRPQADEATQTPPHRGTGRVRHDEKITVYISTEELLALEHARLALRAEHGLAVDRGRIVREAVAAALGDLVERGSDSELMKRLRGA
ncbi:hypothetical protein GGQ54_002981 [Naumannella cuiyingiana]|uniref:Uncharacterized protein n=1 Tax=Naumannella cuiyingiana TaxID=1347891 RepID=A0A7Z0DBQ8_9ACTN|nr:hypothetical protein [Naumannella cuiyingiana]